MHSILPITRLVTSPRNDRGRWVWVKGSPSGNPPAPWSWWWRTQQSRWWLIAPGKKQTNRKGAVSGVLVLGILTLWCLHREQGSLPCWSGGSRRLMTLFEWRATTTNQTKAAAASAARQDGGPDCQWLTARKRRLRQQPSSECRLVRQKSEDKERRTLVGK